MRVRKLLSFIICIFCSCCFLFMPQSTARGAAIGLNICGTAVLPSLFPFFVISNFCVGAGYTDVLSRFFAPLAEHLFHIPGSASTALILGSIGGYPVGAKTVANLYSAGALTKEQAEHTTMFCNNAGPAFILNVVGVQVFQSTKIGIILYVVHLISACIIGIVFRPKQKENLALHCHNKSAVPSVSQLWTTSISDAGKTAVLVCTFILFFSILTQCLQSIFTTGPILTGILELAGGAKKLSATNISQEMKLIISAFLLGFGGLCVMLQSLSILQAEGLSGKKLIIGKCLHGLTSTALIIPIVSFLPLPHPCGFETTKLSHMTLQSLLLVTILLGVLKFLKESSGKVKKNQL